MSNEPVSERTRQRRRILRAVAGTPIVLTLPSGAALAAGSLTCDVKSFNAFDPDVVTGFPTDSGDPSSWMRYKLPKLLMLPDGQGGGNGSNGRVPGFALNGTYYKVEDDVAIEFVPNMNGANGPTSTGEFYYGLVDYNAGSPVLVLDKTTENGINPIAGASCWNSLTGDQLTSNIIIN